MPRMTKVPKVSTRVVEYTIRDEDLRKACAQFLVSADRLLAHVRTARLEREWAALTTRLNGVFAQMKAAEARGATLFPFLQRIEQIEADRDRNLNERFPERVAGVTL